MQFSTNDHRPKKVIEWVQKGYRAFTSAETLFKIEYEHKPGQESFDVICGGFLLLFCLFCDPKFPILLKIEEASSSVNFPQKENDHRTQP